MKKGFTILELLVAAIVVCIAIGLVLKMLHDQNSNMVGIRQRVQAQTSARDGLKILESELRISGFVPNISIPNTGRPDSIGSYTSTCLAMVDANGSSVSASDGTGTKSDTLIMAYPTLVSPTAGADCIGSVQWSRYNLDGSGNLMRTTATTRAGLATSIATTMVAGNVDVFQIRLGVMGMATPAAMLLSGAEVCCTGNLGWQTSNATASLATPAAGITTVTPIPGSAWRFLSPVNKSTSQGERLRDTFTILPSAAFFTDVVNGATLFAGIFDPSGNAVSGRQILTIPVAAQSISNATGGLTFSIDLPDSAGGANRRIGLTGVSKSSPGSIQVKSMNAFRAGAGAGGNWFKDPDSMATSDWSRTKAVEVILLSNANSDDGTKASSYKGLANYNNTGTFTANDAHQRVRFDHVYPVGNNGGF